MAYSAFTVCPASIHGFVVYPHVRTGCRNNVVNTYTSTSWQTAPKQCAPHTNEQTTRDRSQRIASKRPNEAWLHRATWYVKALVASHCSHLASISFTLVLQRRAWNPIDVYFITQHSLLCSAVEPQLIRSLFEVTLPVTTAQLSIRWHGTTNFRGCKRHVRLHVSTSCSTQYVIQT